MNATPSIRDNTTTCGLPRSDAMSVLRDPATGDFPWTAMLLQCTLVSSWYWICDQVGNNLDLGAIHKRRSECESTCKNKSCINELMNE